MNSIQHLVRLSKERSILTQKIRNFFTKNNFIEVETPIMVRIPGMEPHLDPFETTLKTPQKKEYKFFLNTSPELQMKKLLGQGLKKIFNITKVFRNGEISETRHNPEFTMIEWYRQKADYKDLMKDCENLIKSLATKSTINYQNHKININKPWERLSTNELFMKYCKIDLTKNRDLKTFKKIALEKKFDTNGCKDWDDIFFKIFLNHIEPNLGFKKPTFVYDYPTTQAALAKKKKSNPFFAERFELYIAGVEITNAFSELIDPKEQRQRLQEEQNLRKRLGKTVFDIDEEFLASLKSIRYPSAGIALGIDRLFMILLNKKNMEDTLLFPIKTLL
ncbi:EF-P lysine aminoacylase GenX [Candidatus Peregrinibacteria bacterium]|nr:EF-P lysine aminoacylase GenX [Candidatus Peregrinibacteria bacterium]